MVDWEREALVKQALDFLVKTEMRWVRFHAQG